MSDITVPAGLLISGWEFGQKTFSSGLANAASGAEQVSILGPSRWKMTMGTELNLKPAQAALWRKMLIALCGRTNRLVMYDLANPAPLGTYRGSPVLQTTVAAGVKSIVIVDATQAGKTLLAGDWVSITGGGNSQLLSVAADATANGSGVMTVTFEPTLRYGFTGGSATIQWDKPTTTFRRADPEVSWSSKGAMQGGFSVSFIESWEP